MYTMPDRVALCLRFPEKRQVINDLADFRAVERDDGHIRLHAARCLPVRWVGLHGCAGPQEVESSRRQCGGYAFGAFRPAIGGV